MCVALCMACCEDSSREGLAGDKKRNWHHSVEDDDSTAVADAAVIFVQFAPITL